MIELKPTIYIIDDDKSVLRSLGRLLAICGFEIREFGSAEEFLRQNLTDVRGCLLLDIHMPEMNGLELQAHLKKAETKIPIIFITGHVDDDISVAAGMEHGAIACMYKPLEKEKLLATINLAIEKGHNLS